MKFDPILTAASSCTAHAHSVEAIPAVRPIVLASGIYRENWQVFPVTFDPRLHPTTQERRYRHRGDAYLKVQKYRPPAVGAADASSARAHATVSPKAPQKSHCWADRYGELGMQMWGGGHTPHTSAIGPPLGNDSPRVELTWLEISG